MSKFNNHKYEYSRPFESERHQWSLIGPAGGIHFHASVSEKYGPSCGLEFHHVRGHPDYVGQAPSQSPCWLLGEPCWHDGTSLYANELWPNIEYYLRDGRHGEVFRLLEREYEKRFEREGEVT